MISFTRAAPFSPFLLCMMCVCMYHGVSSGHARSLGPLPHAVAFSCVTREECQAEQEPPSHFCARDGTRYSYAPQPSTVKLLNLRSILWFNFFFDFLSLLSLWLLHALLLLSLVGLSLFLPPRTWRAIQQRPTNKQPTRSARSTRGSRCTSRPRSASRC